jgi:aspartyl-tRNA(Asn)/glutamyl-tRNA(Gln) amidotransferase subunit B
VLFDPDTGETRAMRTKEDAADYRYFPDPDLPPLAIAPEWIERVRSEMPELPRAMAERYVREHGLSDYDATQLTQSPALARYFEEAVRAGAAPKLASNWITGEIARRLNLQDIDIARAPVTAAQLAALLGRIGDGTVSNNAARQVFDALWTGEGREVDAIIDAKGLKQMSDTGALEKIVEAVLAANQKNIDEYRAGKEKAFNALVGQVMKASQGKANPAQVNALLKAKLG